MSDLNDRKVSLLRKEVVARYKESPGSADEQVIALLDFNSAKPLIEVYALIGEDEHPVHAKSSWISEVAANVTIEGYWAWVKDKIDNDKYVMNGSQIMLRGEMVGFATPQMPTMPGGVDRGIVIGDAPVMITMPTRGPDPFILRDTNWDVRINTAVPRAVFPTT